mmetsp:Transcript_60203/g.195383  ORF Transcript_60203/g.195383 Transcript_60203/m.195383 type:complete len:205 (+) Transcript_60203:466-1080(+)
MLRRQRFIQPLGESSSLCRHGVDTLMLHILQRCCVQLGLLLRRGKRCGEFALHAVLGLDQAAGIGGKPARFSSDRRLHIPVYLGAALFPTGLLELPRYYLQLRGWWRLLESQRSFGWLGPRHVSSDLGAGVSFSSPQRFDISTGIPRALGRRGYSLAVYGNACSCMSNAAVVKFMCLSQYSVKAVEASASFSALICRHGFTQLG